MTASVAYRPVDLRRDPLSALRAIDYRHPERDYWADEAAIHDRCVAVWAGLDDSAWRLPGAAPSDAGPDWALLDHVGHVVDGCELASGYIADVLFRGTPPAELRERFATGLARLRAASSAMSDAEWLDPEGFSWAYEDLHGHVRAHHAMIGPWAARVGWPAPVAAGPGR